MVTDPTIRMMNTLLLADLIPPGVDVPIILPELIVAFTGIVVMLYDTIFPTHKKATGALSIVGLIISGLVLGSMWSSGVSESGWNGMISHDNLRVGFSFVFLLVSAVTILISSIWIDRESVPAGEYHALLLFATFGMMLMSAGNDLVVIFLGLETLSLATYVMAGLRRGDLKSNESSMKYFILGSFASAFLLYGMSLVYGATGSTNITEIAAKTADPHFPGLMLIGAAMMIVGFGFKIAMAPFHVWTPDVYEGAPTPITAFMATGAKAAAFSSFIRVFVLGMPLIAGVQASVYLHQSWIAVLTVLAMATIIVGNVAAILQDNVKRMLAYSSIAHAGYALVGFVGAGLATNAAARDEAVAAVAFYLLTYTVTNLGAFAIVAFLSQKNDRRADFEDYNGIGFRSPVLAFSLSLFMLSLLGLPLTAGFMGKVLVFRPALEAGNDLLTVLVVVAVIGTAISAYYYLRLIVVMFFRERATKWVEPRLSGAMGAILLITVVGVLYLGVFADGLINRFAQQPAPTVVASDR